MNLYLPKWCTDRHGYCQMFSVHGPRATASLPNLIHDMTQPCVPHHHAMRSPA
jgi:hypothetical protein